MLLHRQDMSTILYCPITLGEKIAENILGLEIAFLFFRFMFGGKKVTYDRK